MPVDAKWKIPAGIILTPSGTGILENTSENTHIIILQENIIFHFWIHKY